MSEQQSLREAIHQIHKTMWEQAQIWPAGQYSTELERADREIMALFTRYGITKRWDELKIFDTKMYDTVSCIDYTPPSLPVVCHVKFFLGWEKT